MVGGPAMVGRPGGQQKKAPGRRAEDLYIGYIIGPIIGPIIGLPLAVKGLITVIS